jgi:hypothetical protein
MRSPDVAVWKRGCVELGSIPRLTVVEPEAGNDLAHLYSPQRSPQPFTRSVMRQAGQPEQQS